MVGDGKGAAIGVDLGTTYSCDANGILNVTAKEKTTGNANKLRISNENGRLSKEEIDRMVREAEKYKSEDNDYKRKTEAKNALENYTYKMKIILKTKEIGGKLSWTDKRTIDKAIKHATKWLEKNELVEAEELDCKKKELEATCNPIIVNIYQNQLSGAAAAANDEKVGGSTTTAFVVGLMTNVLGVIVVGLLNIGGG